MKKVIFFLTCVIVLFLCSCSSQQHITGYENFSTSHSHYELNLYTLPDETFVDTFQYISIDYDYRDEYKSIEDFYERSVVVIEYEKEIYEQAKKYCLENMQLSDSNILEYNDYVFIENIKLAVAQDRYGKASGFPHWFNMFAYNDDLHCLVFMGIFCTHCTSNDTQYIQDNWEEYLTTHFPGIAV